MQRPCHLSSRFAALFFCCCCFALPSCLHRCCARCTALLRLLCCQLALLPCRQLLHGQLDWDFGGPAAILNWQNLRPHRLQCVKAQRSERTLPSLPNTHMQGGHMRRQVYRTVQSPAQHGIAQSASLLTSSSAACPALPLTNLIFFRVLL